MRKYLNLPILSGVCALNGAFAKMAAPAVAAPLSCLFLVMTALVAAPFAVRAEAPAGPTVTTSASAAPAKGPGGVTVAPGADSTGADFQKYAMKLRESAILKMEPPVRVQTSAAQTVPAYSRNARLALPGRYPWRERILTTVFWIGEGATERNPTPNRASSWDQNWMGKYGGVDDPARRSGYLPVGFTPGQNPFYIALPYNDVTRGTTKPEASLVIPWFKQEFERAGKSVCKGRWIAIRRGNRVCYAQWEDCGPFRTDHWQYVFGKERPKDNINGGAGLDISPAVRDYLGMSMVKEYCDWKFVDFSEVPPGPWSRHGDNNDFVQKSRRVNEQLASGRR